MSNTGRYGVINEIGDMGLGFNEVSDKEQEIIKEQEKKDSDSNKNA